MTRATVAAVLLLPAPPITLSRPRSCAQDQLAQLRITQRGRLARGAADHDALRTVRGVKFEQPLPGGEVNFAACGHRRDDGNQAAGKHKQMLAGEALDVTSRRCA